MQTKGSILSYSSVQVNCPDSLTRNKLNAS
nr:MAG TPA: hypothetical protein [Caudoviricetes sp.]